MTTDSPDIAVDITDTFDKKIDALDAHVSQVYEWLPWHAGNLDHQRLRVTHVQVSALPQRHPADGFGLDGGEFLQFGL